MHERSLRDLKVDLKTRVLLNIGFLVGMWLVQGGTFIEPAWAVDTPLSETPEVQFSASRAADLKAKADELGTPVNMYEYLRNNAEYKLYHGSRSGSINTFLGLRGNDVDLASTLIAMLRSQNIPARYAVGTIQMAADDLINWLRVQNLDLAVSVLEDLGIQHVSLSADRTSVELEHVWVEAQVAHDNYRGAGTDANFTQCGVDPTTCHWVSLDPSFKRKAYHNQNIDIYNVLSFDYTSYYEAMKNDDPTRRDKNPLEIYEEQILGYLQTTPGLEGKTLEDVADPGVIIQEKAQVLPNSLPYRVVDSTVRRYHSVADHDAATAVEPKKWGKTVRLTLEVAPDTTVDSGTYLLAELTTKRLTLSWELGSVDQLVARLDGEIAAVPLTANDVFNGESVGLGFPFILHGEMDGPPSTVPSDPDHVVAVTYANLVVGGYYLIGTGGESSNYSQVHRAADQLLEANQQYVIVNDSGGVPYVDANGNGVIDGGEPRLLDHPAAMEALTGGLLHVAMAQYFAELRARIERLDLLNHVFSPLEGFIGVVSSVYEMEYVGGTAFSVLPGGLLIDMKGLRHSGLWRTDAPSHFANEHFELVGHESSSLEHEIWQELTGYDAVSTVRGIQMALASGATLVDAQKNETTDTLPVVYPAFGMTSQAPSPLVRRESEVFGTRQATWYPNPDAGQVHAFYLTKAAVDTSTPALRLGLNFYTTAEGNAIDLFIACVDDLENQLEALFAAQGNITVDVTFCNGTHHIGPLLTVKDELEAYYFGVIDAQGSAAYYDYFDENQGFVPSDHVYRDVNVSENEQDILLVQQIRNDLSFASPFWMQYLIPSRKTSGKLYRFVVYIQKAYVASTNDLAIQSFSIQNQSFTASGGYVDATEALEQETDTTGENFNNALFTDQNLNNLIHNDPIKTPSTTDPVSTVSGNNYHDETDVVLKGRGLNLVLTRTYNSGPSTTNTTGVPMGFGWTHSYHVRLHSNDYGDCPNCPPGTGAGQRPENGDNITSSLSYVDERGGEANYLVGAGANPSLTSPQGVFDALTANWSTGTYTLTFRNGVQYLFEGVAPNQDLRVPGRAARLARIEDPSGNVLTFTYDASGRLHTVSDGLSVSGRTGLTLSYHADHRLKDIKDWTNRTWSYAYDGNGHLVSMTNPRNDTITYDYQPGTHNLTDVILPEDRDSDGVGDVITTFSYYQNGKTFMNRNALGEGETLEYDLYRKQTRVTDPRGFIREYSYDTNGRLTKLLEPDKAILLFENNATDGLRYKKTDGLGFTTTYSYREDRSLNGGASDTGGNVTLEHDALNHTVETDYGLFDQPTRIKDKNGHVRTMVYYQTTDLANGAVKGKLQRESVRMGGVDIPLKDYKYGEGGVPTQTIEYIEPTNPPNTNKTRVTTYEYDPAHFNLLEMEVTGSGQTIRTTYMYDELGRKKSETLERRTSAVDATLLFLTRQYEYDELDRPFKVTDPLGNETVTLYDDNGNDIQTTRRFKKPDGSFDERVVSRKDYDDADRLIRDTDVLGAVTRFRYDAAGNLVETTDANSHVMRYEYDAMGRQTAVINATGHRTQSVYDLAGRNTQTIDPNGHVAQLAYDALGRVTSVTDPLGFVTRNTYDPNGNILTTTDANATAGLQPTNSDGATLSRQYDELNRLVLERDPVNGETRYTYDLLGNRTSLTDAEGHTTTFEYDDLGRLIKTIDPLIETPTDKVVTLTYDEAGNVLTRTNRKGEVTRLTYDVLNRLRKAEYLVADVVTYQEDFVYDHFGDQVLVANNDITYTIAYDAKHRVRAKTDNRPPSTINSSLTYTYDAVGNMKTKTDYQGATTEYRYDSANRLVSLRNPDYVEVSYQYDPAGRLLTRILSNGTTTAYGYNNGNRLLSLTTEHANGSVVATETYTRDRVGNIQTVTTPTGTITYTYDPLYRLTEADYPGGSPDYHYTYDQVGNRLTETIGGTTKAYIYNDGNRLTAIRQGDVNGPLVNQFTYDEEGNMMERRDGAGTLVQSYATDAKGRITQMTGSAGTFTYAYDPLDYRISKAGPGVSAGYLLEGEHVETVTGSHQPAQFFRGVVVDEIVNGYQYDPNGDWTNYTYAHDSLQSVVGLTGHEGRTIETTTYRPFGSELDGAGASCSVLRYTGREQDAETGLYYYRARYYDPEIGRFLTEDPIGFQAGVNFYAYVNNNPINANDPSGLLAPPWHGGVTYFAARDAGLGFLDSLSLAWNSTAVDWRTDTFNPAASIQNLHGTGGILPTGKRQSLQAARLGITDAINTSLLSNDLAGALHNVQDFATPRHFDHTFTGVSFSWDFFQHTLGDWFPSFSTLRQAYDNSLTTIEAFQNAGTIRLGPVGSRGGVFRNTSPSFLNNSQLDSYSGGGSGFGSGFSQFSGLTQAQGGFLLYPNKPNLNMTRSVYSK